MVEMTNRSLFITGKAGTGKTTMLRSIVSRNFKRAVVVAPTGVAAINAEGMTIHSFFQLPFGPAVPTPQGRYSLVAQQKIRKERSSLFCELELLIIDEISMVRVDILDAIDTVLRYYRHRPEIPFGGVQVVFFGDLYQLPPVVTEDEYQLLSPYYQSFYFFDAKVMAELQPVVVELDTIFRQTNADFITLLNELRNNCISPHSMTLLQSRFNPQFQLQDDDQNILLTTHNAKADSVNLRQMASLRTKSARFSASVRDDFPEKSYPADSELELKINARVMFIVNDRQTPRRYYNGMIGIVKSFGENSVTVYCRDTDKNIEVLPEEWANRSYQVDPKTNEIHEKILGTFSQIPLRLAWAITIHKSQGLTFDNVVIDSVAAFASGQVYVAFSRCRTLEGITLTSMVNPSSLRVDSRVVSYCQTALPLDRFLGQLETDRLSYCRQLAMDLFDLRPLYALALEVRAVATTHKKSFSDGIVDFADSLCKSTSDVSTVSSRFLDQLRTISQTELQNRIHAASGYFLPRLDQLNGEIETSRYTTDSRDNAESYLNKLKELYFLVARKCFLMERLSDDFTVKRYFDYRAGFINPRFTVRAYSVESSYDDETLANPQLFYALCRWRTEYCDEQQIPKYIMFYTKTLKEIAATLPTTEKQLLKINGFGKTKVKKFGAKCIELVCRYCEANKIPYDRELNIEQNIDELSEQTIEYKKPKQKKQKEKKPPKVPTIDLTLELLNNGMTLEEVAAERSLRFDTIVNHLCQLIIQHRIDGIRYVDPDVVSFVASKYAADPDVRLEYIYEKLNKAVPYELLRIAKACAESKN